MGEKKISKAEHEFFSTSTVARKVDMSSETIRREIDRGKLRAFRFGREFIISASDFEEWKAKHFKPVV